MLSRVAIVGAGPAGLAAALALRRLGLEVTVFEQAEDYQRIGGGIVLHDNGQRVLQALGLLDSFRPHLQPCPVIAAAARRAGTVHLADSMDELTMYHAQLTCGVIPAKPLIVVGQMTTTDPSRSPPGTETLWAYAHVPQHVRGDATGSITGAWTPAEEQEFADRMQARIEANAPGF